MKLARNLAVAAVAVLAVAVAGPSAGATPKKDIVQTAVAAGKFKTLTALLKQAGLSKALQGRGPYTVFAPTDAAFAKVPKKTLTTLAADKTKLRAVLLYHVAKGRLTAAQVAKRTSIKTLNGQSLRVRLRSGHVTVGSARVVAADVGASNGVIHVINSVLIPR
jgi:uncharacterized surface protein with fasciclin (FAS1) repeats